MNLLYISNLSNNIDAGLNWRVPASVKAQQQYDKVLWVDLTQDAFQEHWKQVSAYHNIKEFGGRIALNVLPIPFNRPDCVIFEGFYYVEHIVFARELHKNNIPYIIIPRGSLTETAFMNGGLLKRLKKCVAHWLLFDRFIYKATAVQYLTKEEQIQSEKKYHIKSFIIPNGVVIPANNKEMFSDGIKGVFIGRQDIFQKGLDILFDAISDLSADLRKANFNLDIYGPPRYDVEKVSELIRTKSIGDIVVNHKRGVGGVEKQQALLNADVFFLTSRFEGHPMGLIEALSYGLPVFITRGSNMLEEVDKYDAGWTCEIEKESVVSAFRRMLQEKHRFTEKSSNARLLASNYGWNMLAATFHKELKTLINKL